jgi:hypothetical protein
MFLFFLFIWIIFCIFAYITNKNPMSVIITDQASTIEFLFSTGERTILDKDNLNIKESGSVLRKHVW